MVQPNADGSADEYGASYGDILKRADKSQLIGRAQSLAPGQKREALAAAKHATSIRYARNSEFRLVPARFSRRQSIASDQIDTLAQSRRECCEVLAPAL